MTRLLREPLAHFMLGGVLLFVLYGAVSDTPIVAPDTIVVDARRRGVLVAGFERTWLRQPTADEIEALVRDYVDEEILYREALALGLDRDDLVVRRRLRQKVEFLLMETDPDALEAPSAGDLEAYWQANAGRFEEPALVSFRQVFIDPETSRPGADADPWRRAARVLTLLERDTVDPDAVADATLLPQQMERASPRAIDSIFGAGFGADVFEAASGQWVGPLDSSFGLHLVYVGERVPSRRPALDEVRSRVEWEFASARRSEAQRRAMQKLRDRYEVEIVDVETSEGGIVDEPQVDAR